MKSAIIPKRAQENKQSKITPYFVYILLCSDGSLYTGITNDIEKRISVHNSGKGSKYVRARLPIKCIYTEKLKNKSLALKREVEIKRLKRGDKLGLIEKI